MKITLWGTRGSLPTPGPNTIRYGGNTSCVSVEAEGQILVLDAGSGIRQVGDYARSFRRYDILISHMHMDHIQGIGFFSPLFNPNAEVHIWGTSSRSESLATRLSRYMSPPLFPVRLRDLPCKLHIHEINQSCFNIGAINICADYINHPSPTLGFRIQHGDSVLAYISDHEPALGVPNFPLGPEWTSGYSLAKDADLLIHDAQYSPEQYVTRQGWGHSSIEHVLAFAQLTHAKHVLLFHHDPAHSDDDLENMYEKYVQPFSLPFKVEIASEAAVYEV